MSFSTDQDDPGGLGDGAPLDSAPSAPGLDAANRSAGPAGRSHKQSGDEEPASPDEHESTQGDGPPAGGSAALRKGYLPRRAYELLPDLLAEPASQIEDRRQRDVFLTGALPVWAGALPNVRFEYGGRAMSPNLYSASVAPPGSGKSALNYARRYGLSLSEEISLEAGQTGGPEGEELPQTRLFLAGDSSAAALKRGLRRNPHGVIFETEIRPLGRALQSTWGGFSDVLLKGFQNEMVKRNRSAGQTMTIPHPAPSIALAGTPATLGSVISGTDDGLFSRFLLYRFDREFEWRSQFEEGDAGLDLEDAAKTFHRGHHRLQEREAPLRVTVPGELQKTHDRAFGALTERWKDEGVPRSLQASLARSGLKALKIATILRGIRLIASGGALGTADTAALRPEEMEAGLRLALTYLLHGVRVETRFRAQDGARAALTDQQRQYLEALPEERFSTADAKALAPRFGASPRNAQRWLKSWWEEGLLTKPKRGTWAKIDPELGGIAGIRSILSVLDDLSPLADG